MRRLIAMAVMTLALCGCSALRTNEVVDRPAMEGFDAVRYGSPTWLSTREESYRLTERDTGKQYWLIYMGTNEGWIVVPIEGDAE